MRWLSSQRSVGFDERNKRRRGGILGEGEDWLLSQVIQLAQSLVYPFSFVVPRVPGRRRALIEIFIHVLPRRFCVLLVYFW